MERTHTPHGLLGAHRFRLIQTIDNHGRNVNSSRWEGHRVSKVKLARVLSPTPTLVGAAILTARLCWYPALNSEAGRQGGRSQCI